MVEKRTSAKWTLSDLPREPGPIFIIVLLTALTLFTAGILVTLGSLMAALALALVAEGLRP
jgi:hypothetical protein